MATQGVPPSIEGYTFERWLGGGGFADVFLYRQHLTEQSVAIKVLRQSVDDEGALGLFVAEANLMAKVSTHPNIVNIYGAGVSLDRRPYMVMQFYPLDHYGKRIEQGGTPAAQVLEVGVKIASAIEVAHNANIVHRDIKPANILASDFGEPGLTDFGISAADSGDGSGESLGFSPPYAPKEILEDSHPGDARSDVYSLAATLWALLAGHAPFERPGERNSKADYLQRGINDPVPPLPAGVAPQSLEAVLRKSLSKDPDRRHQSARAFGEALQSVQRELGLPESRLVLLEDRGAIESAVAEVEAAIEATKKGKGVVVDLDSTTHAGRTKPKDGRLISVPTGIRVEDGPAPAAFVPLPGPQRPAVADTVVGARTPLLEPGADEPLEPTSRALPKWAWGIVGAAAAGLLVMIVITMAGGGEDARPTEATAPIMIDEVVNPGVVSEFSLAPVDDLEGVRNGDEVTFTWTHDPREGMDYVVRRVDGVESVSESVSEERFVLDGIGAEEIPCVTVLARVQGVVESDPVGPVCAST